jgi:hypothetical protein
MKAVWAAGLGLATLALAARPAWPCGSSGGSDSGSSSSSSSDSDSGGSSSSSSSEPACEETSSVVGRSICPENRYGKWRVPDLMPRMRVAYGLSTHRFSLSGMNFSGSAAHGDGIAYRMVGEEVTSDSATALAMDLAFTGRLGRYAYAGVGTSVGRTIIDGARIERPGALSMSASGNLYFEFGALGGVAIPMGSVTVAAEALAGRRVVGLSVDSQHIECESSSLTFDSSWLVETRVSAQMWVSPWLSVGARVGSNTLARGDVSAGVFLQGHTRAFDATRSR